LAIGAGNWSFGGSKMEKYRDRRRLAAQIGGPAVKHKFNGTLSILEPRTNAHDLWDDADLKYEYYRVFARGGRVITIAGALLVTGALVRKLAREKVKP
jgi:hypothetical protein